MQCIKGDFLSRKVLLTTKYTKDDTRGTRKGKEKGQNQKGRNSECLMKRNGEGAFSCLTLNPSIAPLRASRSGMEKGMIIFLPHPQSLSSRRGRHLAT